MVSLHVILYVVALICFLLAAIAVPVPRVNLIAFGLFFWLLAIVLGAGVVVR